MDLFLNCHSDLGNYFLVWAIVKLSSQQSLLYSFVRLLDHGHSITIMNKG